MGEDPRDDREASGTAEGRWWDEGEEPDYRATLANERTFLSWSRTSLGLLAGALAVLRLIDVTPYALRLALTAYLILLAVVTAGVGYAQWRARQRRMRLRQPLGHTGVQALLMLAFLVLVGLVVAAVVAGPK